MDYTLRTRTIQSISKDIKNDTIRLTHKLQRSEGQWKISEKSDLIDSILRKYPINPTYAVKEDGILSIIDGVQRLSTIRDYLNDSFSLSKNLKPIVVKGEEREIAKKKFSKLDEDIKDVLLNAEFQIYELIDCTEEDVREIFRRQNAGRPLNSKQLRVVYGSDDFNETVYDLANHPFMDRIVKRVQRKNGTDKDLIIQSFMLISTTQENDFTSFKIKDMNNYVQNCADEYLDKAEILKKTLDNFEHFMGNNENNEEEIKIPVTSIPMILCAGFRITRDKKSFSKLVEKIRDFLNNYDSNEEYKMFVQSGTSNHENVKGRYDYWRGIIREIQ